MPQPSVLVTGATGFVGRALCPLLSARGLRVIAGMRTQGPHPCGASDARLLGDLARQPVLDGAFDGVDSVVHLAGRAHVIQRTRSSTGHRDQEHAFFAANTAATEQVASAAASAGVRRLIFISSIKVNGESTEGRRPFGPSDLPAPEDAYGRSKLAAEKVLQRIGAATGLEVVIIRPPLLHGPGVKGNIERLLRAIDRGLPLPLAAVQNQRSLLAQDNLCDLIERCLRHPAAAGETLLAADATPISTPDLIRALAAGLQRPARVFSLPPTALRAIGRFTRQQAAINRLIGSLEVDASRTCQRLDWRPQTTTESGLQETAAHYRAQVLRQLR